MTNSQRLGQVRDALRQWMAVHAGTVSNEPASEAMLIRDGFFCGRRFRFPDYSAVWFLEEAELKIHDAQGALCGCCDAQQIAELAAQWQTAHAQTPTQQTLAIQQQSPPIQTDQAQTEQPQPVRTLTLPAHRGQPQPTPQRRAA